MPYLLNPKDFCYETNFPGFETQEEFQPNWNQPKIFPDQRDINFTNRRFSRPSIREYQPLEEDLSPTKSRPEPKPILEVKRSLSAFHKAQDHEKWSRKLEDMINFPQPAKPVLHLPDLEYHRFNLSQTKTWRPGEVYNHLGSISNDPEGVEEFLLCTRAHMISRIYIWPHLPYLESQAFKFQQLFFHSFLVVVSTLTEIRKIPRNLSYLPRPSRYKTKNQIP
ncbi:hypothetical protein Bca101_020241 [Brassica carinata]